MFMKKATIGLGTALIALMLMASASLAQKSGHPYRELPNFTKANERLYRGAQPVAGGMKRLAELGIKSVINLRADDARSLVEEKEAKTAGLRYFNVPMKWYARPTNEEVERVLAIIDDPNNQPVFIHCRRGADRTGTIIAAYRISREGWPGGQALSEADRYGMRKIQFEMRDYIRDYYRLRAGPGAQNHTRLEVLSTAAEATRRALQKSYVVTRKGWKRFQGLLP